MGTRHDTDYIVDVIAEAVERRNGSSARLKRGAQLRQEIKERLAKGEPVEHYRIDWLSAASELVINLMMGIAKEFDESHPDDMASGADLLDIVRLAYNRMKDQYDSAAAKTETK